MQAEAGVIPEGWSLRTVGDLIEFEGGSQPDKSVFRPSWKTGYVRLIQIRDYKSDKYETYIPLNLARRFCTESDIMIGRYGPPIFQILRGLSGAYNVALIKAKPCNAINNSYAYYFLKQEKLFAFIEKLSQRSSGQTGVDLKELRQYPLPLPSIAEQEAIAEALSDADALIESLGELVAKKRHIKQGAMQELLTPKNGWSVEKLEDIADVIDPHPSHRAPPEVSNGIPFVGIGDLNEDGDIVSTRLRTVAAPVFDEHRTRYKIEDGLIGLGRVASIGKVVRLKDVGIPFAVSPTLGVIRGKKVGQDYLFQALKSRFIVDQFARIMSGSTRSSVGMVVLRQLDVPIPRSEVEQTAISTALADMDTEITELENQLAKTLVLKQGMMHQLLTGEIRLL